MIKPLPIRYRSLISGSGIIQFAILFGILLSLISLTSGSTFGLIIFAGFASMGLGISVQNLLQWEKCQLVPGLVSALSKCAIHYGIGMWLGIVLLSAVFDISTLLLLTGLGLLNIGMGLLMGIGSRLAFPFFVTIGIGIFATAKSDELTQFFLWFATNPHNILDFVGLGFTLLGAASVGWFYVVATSPSTIRRFKSYRQFQAHKAKVGDKLAPNRKLKLDTRHFWLRLNQLAYPSFTSGIQAKITLAVVGAVYLAIMIYNRGDEKAVAPFQVIGSMFVMFGPVTFLSMRIPQSFERLWITGAANSRTELTIQLVRIAGFKSILVTLMVLFGLMVQTPIDSSIIASTIMLVSIAFGLGGVFVGIAAAYFRYWVHHRDGVQLTLIAFGSMTGIGLFVICQETLNNFQMSASKLEMAIAMSAIPIIATAIWTCCLIFAGYRLGNEKQLLE